jgi:hypothetical protein
MFGILLSAFWTVLGFLLRSVVVKFVVFFALYFIAVGFMSYLASKLPGASALTSSLANLSPAVWDFAGMFKVGFGISSCVAAYVLRFCIRRMPVVG